MRERERYLFPLAKELEGLNSSSLRKENRLFCNDADADDAVNGEVANGTTSIGGREQLLDAHEVIGEEVAAGRR